MEEERLLKYQPFAALRLWYWADRCARSALMSLTSASRDATCSCSMRTCAALTTNMRPAVTGILNMLALDHNVAWKTMAYASIAP